MLLLNLSVSDDLSPLRRVHKFVDVLFVLDNLF